MAFARIHSQGVRSDLGFEVECIDRFRIDYSEGNRRIEVEVEYGWEAGTPCVIVQDGAFTHWTMPPAPLLREKQTEVSRRFKEAMEFLGLKVAGIR